MKKILIIIVLLFAGSANAQFSAGISAGMGVPKSKGNYVDGKTYLSAELFGRYSFAKYFFVDLGANYSRVNNDLINVDALVVSTGKPLSDPELSKYVDAFKKYDLVGIPINIGFKYPIGIVSPLVSIGATPTWNLKEKSWIDDFFVLANAKIGASININKFSIEPKVTYSLNFKNFDPPPYGEHLKAQVKHLLGGQVSLLYNF